MKACLGDIAALTRLRKASVDDVAKVVDTVRIIEHLRPGHDDEPAVASVSSIDLLP